MSHVNRKLASFHTHQCARPGLFSLVPQKFIMCSSDRSGCCGLKISSWSKNERYFEVVSNYIITEWIIMWLEKSCNVLSSSLQFLFSPHLTSCLSGFLPGNTTQQNNYLSSFWVNLLISNISFQDRNTKSSVASQIRLTRLHKLFNKSTRFGGIWKSNAWQHFGYVVLIRKYMFKQDKPH